MFYPRSLNTALCQLLGLKHGQNFEIKICDVTQLPIDHKYTDCGLAALCCLVVLCHRCDPRTITDLPIKSRGLILKCFEESSFQSMVNEEMDRVPNSSRETTVKVEISCCNTPDDGTNYVKCCKCDLWFHKECKSDEAKRCVPGKDDHICKECKEQNNHKFTSLIDQPDAVKEGEQKFAVATNTLKNSF